MDMKPGFVVICAILTVLAAPTGAETPVAQSKSNDFTFKRVAIPEKGAAGARITVQIDPDAEVYRITPGEAPRRPGGPRVRPSVTWTATAAPSS